MNAIKAQGWKFTILLVTLLFGGLVLAACGDEPAPGPRDVYIKGAIDAANGGTPLPLPTVDQSKVLDLKLILINGPLFYTRQVSPPAMIQFYVINAGMTTVYISSCEGQVLQRKEGEDWINIASARHCGSQPSPIPLAAGAQNNLSFEFAKAATYPGQDFNIPGTYRFLLQYALSCPPSRGVYASCIDRRWQTSTEFQLKPFPDDAVPVKPTTAPTTK